VSSRRSKPWGMQPDSPQSHHQPQPAQAVFLRTTQTEIRKLTCLKNYFPRSKSSNLPRAIR
jgi:hypothetical protein